MKLYDFYRENWQCIDSAPFKSSWHLEALCDRLEVWARGKVPNLVVAMPPNCGASALFSVALPVWLWCEVNPSGHILTASDSIFMTQRDAHRSDRLIKMLAGKQVEQCRTVPNKSPKSLLVNAAGGTRRSSFPGSRAKFKPEEKPADFAIVDRPMLPKHPFGGNTLKIQKWWDETIAKPETRWVLVTPRLEKKDLVGFLLDRSDLEFCYIPIPLHYSRSRVVDCNLRPCPGWKDPRKEGELLWKERYPEKGTMQLIRSMGKLRASAQLQQSPAS